MKRSNEKKDLIREIQTLKYWNTYYIGKLNLYKYKFKEFTALLKFFEEESKVTVEGETHL